MRDETQWTLPALDERLLWRVERPRTKAVLTITSLILFLVATAFTLLHARAPRIAGAVAGVIAGALAVAALRLARSSALISNVRAAVLRGSRSDHDLPLAQLSSVTVEHRALYRPVGAADIIIRTRDGSIRLPLVENWAAALTALSAVIASTGLAFDRAVQSDETDMYVPMPRGDVKHAFDLETLQRSSIPPAVLFGPLVVIFTFLGLMIFGAARSSRISYPKDDAIYPNGVKRSRAEIVALMEQEVMPFAKKALAPIVGGEEKVTCLTCHGTDAEARDWRMPAVRRLPDPRILENITEERLRSGSTVQNAIYGYLAEKENQNKMRWMRDVVMPGMARILHRPAYDFTRSYAYNQQRFAFGCYNCHRLDQRPEE